MRKDNYVEVKQQAIKKKNQNNGPTVKSKRKFKNFLRKMTTKIQRHKIYEI